MLLGFPASTTKSWQGERKLLLFDLVSLFPVPSWIYPLLLYRQWKLKNSKQLFWHIQSCYTWVLRVSGFCAAAKVKQEDFIFSFYCRLYLCWNKTRSGWNFLLAAPWREGAELDLIWLLLTKKTEILLKWLYTEQRDHWALLFSIAMGVLFGHFGVLESFFAF